MYQPVTEFEYTVEVKLVNAPAQGQKVPFVDIPQLRQGGKSKKELVKTIGIQAFNATDITVSPTTNAIVPVLTGMVLTLSVGSDEDIYQVPVNDLRSAANSGLIRLFKEKQINFPKSYITILDATGLAVSQSVLFNIIYRK